MSPLRAASEFPWPLIIVAILFALFGRKKPAARGRTAPNAEAAGQGAFLGQLQQALAEMKKAEREARRTAVTRPVRPLPDDDAGLSLETPSSLEDEDYDEEAVRIAAARRSAAEQAELAAASAEDGATVPTRAEEAPVQAPPRRRVLGRFADGSPRGAIIVAEILGRPKGER